MNEEDVVRSCKVSQIGNEVKAESEEERKKDPQVEKVKEMWIEKWKKWVSSMIKDWVSHLTYENKRIVKTVGEQ